MFLELSVPILATLISSITNSYEQIGEQTAASMMHPAVPNFKEYSLEFLGATGAAHGIGSLRAMQDEGLSREVVKPWIKILESPEVYDRRRTELSTEALRMYTKDLGDFHIHLLESCPMAFLIGRQHGQKPFIALDRRRCRVWCPSENRRFANRVQNNVPIFAIDSPLKPGRVNRDSAQCAHLEQPATRAEESTEDSARRYFVGLA